MNLARTFVVGATSAAVLVGATMLPASADPVVLPTPESPLPLDCAWSAEVSPSASNVYYPDTAATYWATPYVIDSGATIEVAGTYPDARYLSLVTYEAEGGYFTSDAGVRSWLADYEIKPDKGSKNPFTKKNKKAKPGGSYTVTVTADARRRDRNALPQAPNNETEGETGYLVVRVYQPKNGNSDKVRLPTITIHDEAGSTTLPRCDELVALDTVPPDTNRPRKAEAFARQPIAGLFPNPHNAYLTMDYRVPRGDSVLVVRGKAPRNPGGDQPVTWPDRGSDVRYYSMCNTVFANPYPVVYNDKPRGATTYGCATDDETILDDQGYYTYVIGPERHRNAVAKIEGTTFVPTSTKQRGRIHKLVFRNMLSSGGFDQAVDNVPEDSRPRDAAEVMGAYYPTTDTMSLTRLRARGVGSVG
jgi:hypothetical protein